MVTNPFLHPILLKKFWRPWNRTNLIVSGDKHKVIGHDPSHARKTEAAVKTILVTGSTGQIGSELTPALRERYGADRVIAAGHRTRPDESLLSSGPYVAFDIRDRDALEKIITHYDIGTIYHLSALLSAVAEERPQPAWDININGLLHVLEAARLHGCGVFHPSSIGAFGPSTPRDNTPQETIQRPRTMYGITKVTGELLRTGSGLTNGYLGRLDYFINLSSKRLVCLKLYC